MLTTRYYTLLFITLVFALVGNIPLSVGSSVSDASYAKLDASLEQILGQGGQESVAIIVQETAVSADVETQVVQLGGTVEQELPIIQGFSARVPVNILPQLASLPAVKHISYDGVVRSSSGQANTILDSFDSISPNNNHGSVSWAGSWIEVGESTQDLGKNDIQIRYNQNDYRLRVRDDDNAVYRLANLSGAASATLSYTYRRVSLDSASEYVMVEVSSDGGTNWTELTRHQGSGTDSDYSAASFDISAHISSQTAVRFRTPAGSMENDDRVFFDDVKIEFSTDGDTASNDESLVAAYAFETGEGIKVVDTSGHSNSGVQVGSAWETKGYAGKAIFFDGVDDYVMVPDSSSLDITGELTIEVWVNPSIISSNKKHPIAYKDMYPVNYGLTIVGSEVRFSFLDGIHETTTSGANIQADEWTHIAVVYNDSANSVVIYIDGTAVASQYEYGSLPVNDLPVRVGTNPLGDYFDGKMDELRIYKRALSAAEVQEDMVTPIVPSDEDSPTVLPGDYLEAMGVDQLSAVAGSGITVAVVDSGVDEKTMGKPAKAAYSVFSNGQNDQHGHGTFMAGIIGNLTVEGGQPISVAPEADIVDVRVLDADGKGDISGVISGLDWILKNRTTHDIRVVNMSLMGPVTGPYWENPLNQAVEALWDAGIVVVVAAGNTGPQAGSITTPGNDPFVITVGAFTDNYTPTNMTDDYIPPFSGAGPSEAGFVKPDVIAPGAHILMKLHNNSTYAQKHSKLHKGNSYYLGSGTSAATAATSGLVALLLEHNPSLTPNEVKYRLMASAKTAVRNDGSLAYSIFQQGAGKVWAPEAVLGNYSGSANTGMVPGEAYVGPVIYDEVKQGYLLVDQNRNPLSSDKDYFWDGKYYWDSGNFWGGSHFQGGGNFWGGGSVWSGGNFWGGSYFTNSSYYWNSTIYWDGDNYWSGNHYWGGLTPEQP